MRLDALVRRLSTVLVMSLLVFPVLGVEPPFPTLPDAIPAFPGAWGGGMFATGGRGGRAVEVTNLNDSGPGSFRDAVTTEGARTVVFRVGGIIRLAGPIDIRTPNLTIAGQTAPGDGICVAGGTTSINAANVILRHVRFRRGEVPESPYYDATDDALNGDGPGRVIVDHCSCSWGLDENVSIYRYIDPEGRKLAPENNTIQWTISSEALNPNNHAFGGTWGGRNSTFHHNMFANNTGRVPSIGMSYEFDFRNNVVFNWRHRTMDGGDGTSMVNVIDNYYEAGPATYAGALQYRICKCENRNPPGKWFVDGNYVYGYPAITANNWAGGVQYDPGANEGNTRVFTPFPGWPIDQHNALEAYERVLAGAGATLPKRDAVDRRIVETVRTRVQAFGNGIINSPDDVGGYPVYVSAPAPPDTDHDGMPDVWEEDHGFDPLAPGDGPQDADGDEYTNLEEYLNGTDPNEFIDYHNLENNDDTISFPPPPTAADPNWLLLTRDF